MMMISHTQNRLSEKDLPLSVLTNYFVSIIKSKDSAIEKLREINIASPQNRLDRCNIFAMLLGKNSNQCHTQMYKPYPGLTNDS